MTICLRGLRCNDNNLDQASVQKSLKYCWGDCITNLKMKYCWIMYLQKKKKKAKRKVCHKHIIFEYSEYSYLQFFFPGCTHGIWKFLGEVLKPNCSCDLPCSCSNARSLTHWAKPGIKPTTSWFLVGFVSTEPWLELLCFVFISGCDCTGQSSFSHHQTRLAWSPNKKQCGLLEKAWL